MSVTLAPEDIRAIAVAVAAELRAKPESADSWMSRDEAAAYISVSLRTFTLMRGLYKSELSPALEHPLRWSRIALDRFKLARCAPAPMRARGNRAA